MPNLSENFGSVRTYNIKLTDRAEALTDIDEPVYDVQKYPKGSSESRIPIFREKPWMENFRVWIPAGVSKLGRPLRWSIIVFLRDRIHVEAELKGLIDFPIVELDKNRLVFMGNSIGWAMIPPKSNRDLINELQNLSS